MEEKIQKWEEEIEKITQRQKEMNAKYTEQIGSCGKRLKMQSSSYWFRIMK